VKRGAFRKLAGRMWDEIPAAAREGVEALTVVDEALPHPEFADVYTLGECVTDVWPSGYGDGDTRSELVLYHGSFRALADLDPGFDWADEMWETILHELLHHREAAAGQSGLDDFDWAEEQNLLRWAGLEYDPSFYRAVPAGSDGVVRLDSELFIESLVPPGSDEAVFRWRDHAYSVRVPADVQTAFVQVVNLAGGRLSVVMRRRRPWWAIWRRTATGWPAELARSALPLPADPTRSVMTDRT
jgi:hypothetical protein